MKLGQIESSAQEIVDATAPLVGGRTINIMDTAGIIIASSDRSRIGHFHKGAAEVLEQRQSVRIYPSDLGRYEGAKEGVNLPILREGKLLGVVGVLGHPDQVEDIANLLGVYVAGCLEQAATARRTALRRELRLALLNRMASGTPDTMALLEAGRELSVELELPIRAVAVRLESTDSRRRARLLDHLEERLTAGGLTDPHRDVWGFYEGALLLFKYAGGGFDPEVYLEKVRELAEEQSDAVLTVSAGLLAEDWTELPDTCTEALTLARLCGPGCHPMDNSENRAFYLISRLPEAELERFIGPLYRAVEAGLGGEWLVTVRAYCAAGFSISKAAETLHIHKNTLLYRIKKILSLMGLEEEQGFPKEYFLKLLLVYDRRR